MATFTGQVNTAVEPHTHERPRLRRMGPTAENPFEDRIAVHTWNGSAMVETYYPSDQMEDAHDYLLQAEHAYQRFQREPDTRVPGTEVPTLTTGGNVNRVGIRPTAIAYDELEATGAYGNAGANTEQQMQNFREQLGERARQTIDQNITNAITQGTMTTVTTAEGQTNLTANDIYRATDALAQTNAPEWRGVDTYATTGFNRDQMMLPIDGEPQAPVLMVAGDRVDLSLIEILYVAYKEAEAVEKQEPNFSCNEYRDKAEWLRLYFEIAKITGKPSQTMKHDKVEFCNVNAEQYSEYMKNGEAIFLSDNPGYIATFIIGKETASFTHKPNKREHEGMMLGIEAMAIWLADYYTKEDDAEKRKETREVDNGETEA